MRTNSIYFMKINVMQFIVGSIHLMQFIDSSGMMQVERREIFHLILGNSIECNLFNAGGKKKTNSVYEERRKRSEQHMLKQGGQFNSENTHRNLERVSSIFWTKSYLQSIYQILFCNFFCLSACMFCSTCPMKEQTNQETLLYEDSQFAKNSKFPILNIYFIAVHKQAPQKVYTRCIISRRGSSPQTNIKNTENLYIIDALA